MTGDHPSGRIRPADARFRHWTAPDGWRLRVMDWPRPDGAPARGALLFAGGRGDFIEKYLDAYRHWHAGGWAVTAFDWRSQGGSQGATPGRDVASFDPLVDDLAGLIEAMDASGPRVAIGHSMGGHLLLRALAERKPPLDAAVLVAPMIAINSAPLPPRLAPTIARLMCLAGRSQRPAWKSPPGSIGPGSRRQFHLTGSAARYADEAWWWSQEPGFRLRPPSWGWLRAAFRSGARFTPERLAAIRVKLLLLGTARDRLVSPDAIRRAAALIPGARFHLYDDAAHELLRESDPVMRDALARIDAFFDEALR